MKSLKGLYDLYRKSASVKQILKAVTLGFTISAATTAFASGPILSIQTTTSPATPLSYSKGGDDYHWGQGEDLYLTGFLFDSDLDGHVEQYIPRLSTQSVIVRRRDNPASSADRCTIFVEIHTGRLSYKPTFPILSNPTIQPPTGESNCDVAAILASNIINRGILDTFSNETYSANNIERIDFIFTPGIIAPVQEQLSRTGHIISEKAGRRDSIKIAAITAIDSSGNPASFSNMVTVGPNGTIPLGHTNIRTSYAFLRNEPNSPQGYPVIAEQSQERLTAAFITLDDLGIIADQEYFGFSLFSTDTNQQTHDLTDISTFPDNTPLFAGNNHGDADIYGGSAALYMMDSETSNSPPIANNDAASTSISTAVTINVLGNDSDPDGDTLTVLSTTTPQGGTITINSDQSITYSPAEDFIGTDTFTYEISDGNGGTATATVTIQVTEPDPDFDNDGISDAIDIDDDNDGILDTAEGNADFDGDGSPNHLDLDADGDGILDLEESGLSETLQSQLDTNGDGQIDASNSFGENGLADAIETTADSALVDYNSDGQADGVFDIDSDTHPDFLDLDTDSDGLSDVIEGGFIDANSDGMMDAGQTPTISPPDTDADGLDDYRDTEDNTTNLNYAPVAVNDSASTPRETAVTINVLENDSDSNGDTLTVISATSAQGGTIIINPDQSITYLPADNFIGTDTVTYEISDGNGGTASATITINVTDIGGGAGIPDGSGGVLESGLEGQGASLGLASIIILMLCGALKLIFLFPYKPGISRRTKLMGISLVVILPVSALADPSADSEREFDRRFYLGAGAGMSQLEPRHTTGYFVVDDKNDTAGQIFFGYDISRRLSVEAFYADLGEAGIATASSGIHAGQYGYKLYGISALGYLYNSRDSSDYDFSNNDKEGYYRHEGLSLYARIGISSMENDSNLNYDTIHNGDLHLGGGLEYGFSNGVALRADFVSYDNDAQLVTLTVLKRFGAVSKPIQPTPPVVVETSTPPAVVPVKKAIQPQSLIVPIVHFAFDKSSLTTSEMERLDTLASILKDNPELMLEIRGHTDSIGSRDYNQRLSIKRAQSASEYLTSIGVSKERLKVTGFGEDQPIASNATKAGRSLNRRTEFRNNNSKIDFILTSE